ncbi:hypothetical protein FPFC_020830 [Fructobacillus pseudoficulneus]|uniref:DUF7671 domain-containing protein n=1 Tax=Fructobacillus pseudoficulneus TaxID=220714 RepID=A0A3F3GT15_9LACO|nr:hypothetical protein [Fructobacillus pseudoficulneus]GAP02635.1 hypothetical protein FPFC_020830 [Fructobacillus pseudoficulneus]SEH38709.1 hypothetical protein SAMN05660469_0571 [Fructobacillus pseudoficulneus]
MGKSNQYDTVILYGLMLQEDASGNYQVKKDSSPHPWRIGKHTKGKLIGPGQIFLTEQNQRVLLVKTEPLSFKKRHDYQPMSRFTSETLSLEQFE